MAERQKASSKVTSARRTTSKAERRPPATKATANNTRPNPGFVTLEDGRRLVVPDSVWEQTAEPRAESIVRHQEYVEGSLRVQLRDGGDIGWWREISDPIWDALKIDNRRKGKSPLDRWFPDALEFQPAKFLPCYRNDSLYCSRRASAINSHDNDSFEFYSCLV